MVAIVRAHTGVEVVVMNEKLSQFRKEFRDETPWWYRGELHLAFTVGFTAWVIWYCWTSIAGATFWEWSIVLPGFLFGNYIEWAGHRYILHRPVKGLRMVYKRHVGTHHQFFTHKDLSYKGHKDWRALLFPPFAPVLFVLSAVPVALLIGGLWSANAAFIMVLAMAVYYLLYEGLHTLAHIENSPFLDRLPLVNSVRRMHIIHHHPGLMQTRNFNLTFPICDALFGTSDLNRGLWGTLFNGPGHEAMKDEDRRQYERWEERHGVDSRSAAPSGASADGRD